MSNDYKFPLEKILEVDLDKYLDSVGRDVSEYELKRGYKGRNCS